MSAADHAACVDAGRGEPPDPLDRVDAARKEARERGEVCPHCGAPARAVTRHGQRGGRYGTVYYVDLHCDACGHVTVDEEGGV
jgi:hypothetical protein